MDTTIPDLGHLIDTWTPWYWLSDGWKHNKRDWHTFGSALGQHKFLGNGCSTWSGTATLVQSDNVQPVLVLVLFFLLLSNSPPPLLLLLLPAASPAPILAREPKRLPGEISVTSISVPDTLFPSPPLWHQSKLRSNKKHHQWWSSATEEFLNLLFATLAGAGVPEALCKRVVINFQLGDLLILISRHRDECAFLKAHIVSKSSCMVRFKSPWRRRSWRWSKGAAWCRSPSPDGTGAGTCASSSGSSDNCINVKHSSIKVNIPKEFHWWTISVKISIWAVWHVRLVVMLCSSLVSQC